MDYNGGSYGSGDTGGEKKWYKEKRDFKKYRGLIIIGVIAVVVIALISSCWYTINDKQKGVI
ncbi:MAG: hypothetical protein IJT56_10520, partial [Clostridia bacterium]|nr:hypothetical protein [Clostridia bacterium]